MHLAMSQETKPPNKPPRITVELDQETYERLMLHKARLRFKIKDWVGQIIEERLAEAEAEKEAKLRQQ